jgi:hypothetical protein
MMEQSNPVAQIPQSRSSVELTRNAKGDYQWSLKVYFDEGAQEQALATVGAMDAQLRATYLGA